MVLQPIARQNSTGLIKDFQKNMSYLEMLRTISGVS